MGAVAVFALNHEFLAVRREIKNGSYSPWAYLISNFLFQASKLFARDCTSPRFRVSRSPAQLEGARVRVRSPQRYAA